MKHTHLLIAALAVGLSGCLGASTAPWHNIADDPEYARQRSQDRGAGIGGFGHMALVRLGGPVLAETVEKVRTIQFFATIVRLSRACSNIASTKSRILNHYFKNFELRDFFNMA